MSLSFGWRPVPIIPRVGGYIDELTPVVLTDDEVAALTEIASDPTNEITVDLATLTIRLEAEQVHRL